MSAAVQELYAAPRVLAANPGEEEEEEEEEEEAFAVLCCGWGPEGEAKEPLTPPKPLKAGTGAPQGMASDGTAPLSGARRLEVAIPVFGTAILPSHQPLSLMGDAETIAPSQCDLTDAGGRLHFYKDRNNENHATENRVIVDALIHVDFGSTSIDPFELVCGTEGQLSDGENPEIELRDEWSSETKMEDDRMANCEDFYGECEEKVDHSYNLLEKHNGTAVQRNNGKGDATTDGEQNGVVRDLVLPPTKDGCGADSMTLQDGVPPLQNVLIPPTGDEFVANLQNGLSPLQDDFSRNPILPPTKDRSVTDSVTLQNGVFPIQNVLSPSGDGSFTNLQNGGCCGLTLPPTKDGAIADSVTLQNGVIPSTGDGSIAHVENGSAPLWNILPSTKDGSIEDRRVFQNGVSPLHDLLPPTGDESTADSMTLENGISHLRNSALLPIRDESMGSRTTLQNGLPSLCDLTFPPTGEEAINNQMLPLPTDRELAILDDGNEILLAERDDFSCNLSMDSHSPLFSLNCDPELQTLSQKTEISNEKHLEEKHPETTKMADESLVPLPEEVDVTSGVSLDSFPKDGEVLGACRIHLPLDKEMPPVSQNGGNNGISAIETRRNNMVEVLRPSVPYVDDLCVVLETWTISEDLNIITESNVNESNEMTQILVHKSEETQQFIPEERHIDEMTQTVVLKPEETQTPSHNPPKNKDGDASGNGIPDPSESSVEKTEWPISAFTAAEQEIMLPSKALENTTLFGDIMSYNPPEMTASSALQNGHLLPDIVMSPSLKCLNGVSSGQTKRRKILEIEHPLGGFSRRTESVTDNNRALHQNLRSPKWPKRSMESSGTGQRPLRNAIPPPIVRSVNCVKRRVGDYPLRTIKHPFILSKMAAKSPQISPFASLGCSSNMDPSGMTAREHIASLADIFRPTKHVEEMSLLKKLSSLANRILAPQRSKPLLNTPKFGRKTIPDLLSSVVSANDGRNVKKSNLQSSFSLFPLELASFCIFDLSSKSPLFQFKMASVPIRKSTQAWKETHVQLPFEWTFSFLLSQNITGPIPNSSPVKKDGGCPVGLQTVLALFSPSYSRLWARKWRFPVRRLTFFQFSRASKDSHVPPSDLFASLLSATFNNGFPTWRQLDPPSSEIPLLHSPQEVASAIPTFPSPWTRLDLQNSTAMLPPATGKSMELSLSPKDNIRGEPSFSASTSTFLLTPEPRWSRLLAPAFPVRNSLDELDVPVPAFPQSKARHEEAESEKKPKKVSQIRIRKTIPKPDPNLTPMGLPRPKRLKKTEFSLEEIYTNKNYKSPPATRSLETIFEEPKERNGALVSVSHQKRKRVLEFPDFTLPRKRRPRGKLRPAAQGFTRAQKAALDGRELDALLLQRLTDLEAALARQEERRDHAGS